MSHEITYMKVSQGNTPCSTLKHNGRQQSDCLGVRIDWQWGAARRRSDNVVNYDTGFTTIAVNALTLSQYYINGIINKGLLYSFFFVLCYLRLWDNEVPIALDKQQSNRTHTPPPLSLSLSLLYSTYA